MHLGGNGETITAIVDGINRFLKSSRELVILNLSHTLNTDLGVGKYRPFNDAEWDRLLDELCRLEHRFKAPGDPRQELTHLKLADFIGRGPAVVVVIDGNGPSSVRHFGEGFYRSRESFDIYDSYSDTNELGRMVDDQLRKMQEQTGKQHFLLSWTLTQSPIQAATCGAPRVPSIRGLAKHANQALPERLFPHVSAAAFPNIIYTDDIVDAAPAALAMATNRVRQ